MKKIIISLMLVSCALASNAQTWLGGSVGMTYKNVDDRKTTSFSFSPVIGYELSEKWEIGMELSYIHNKNNYSNSSSNSVSSIVIDQTVRSNNFAVKPFVRYNFAKAGIATFFVDGGIGYTYTSSKAEVTQTTATYLSDLNITKNTTTSTSEPKANEISIAIRPGVKFEVSKHVDLETHIGFLGYSHSSSKDSAAENASTSKTDYFGLTAGSESLNLGIIYKF